MPLFCPFFLHRCPFYKSGSYANDHHKGPFIKCGSYGPTTFHPKHCTHYKCILCQGGRLLAPRRLYWLHHPGDFHLGEHTRRHLLPSTAWSVNSQVKHKTYEEGVVRPMKPPAEASTVPVISRSSCRRRARDQGLVERLLATLPANYSWLLQVCTCTCNSLKPAIF